MTSLEYLLTATFASIGLVPLFMAVRWERRLRVIARRSARATDQAASNSPRRGGADETRR